MRGFHSLELENPAFIGKEKDIFVGGGREEVFYGVFFSGSQPDNTFAASGLLFESFYRQTFYKAIPG